MDPSSPIEMMTEEHFLSPSAPTPLASQEHGFQILGQEGLLLARTNFLAFIRVFRPAPPTGSFIFSPLHRLLASAVQDIADGQANARRGISVPPQHGKSEISSKLAAAWLMGAFPGMNVAYTSHSNSLCIEVSDAVRDIVTNRYYQLIFPGTDVKYGSNRKDSWTLTNGSSFKAKPAGSKFTGQRIDWLIVDDPHKGREEAESTIQREKVIKWYFADLMTRLSPGAVVYVIQTRWHPEDLLGILASPERVKQLQESNADSEMYTCTTVPAICENPETDPLGRQIGEACFPQLRNEEFLHNIKQSLPSYEWDSQYQQRPRLTGSGNIDFTKIQYCGWHDVPMHLEIVRHWDLAVSEDQAADFTVGAMVAYDKDEDRLYIILVNRYRKNWISMRKAIIERARAEAKEYGVGRIGVEAVAGFIAAYQDLKNVLLGEVRVQATKPTKSKLARATPWLNKIEAGRVFLVRGSWNKDFIDELEQFPSGAHDDQVDSVSGAWELLAGRERYTTTARKETGLRSTLGRPTTVDRSVLGTKSLAPATRPVSRVVLGEV